MMDRTKERLGVFASSGVGLLLGLGIWVTLMADEPGPEIARLTAENAVLRAELVVVRDSLAVYPVWLNEANARLAEACRLLPFRDADECRYVVDTRLQRRGTR